VNTNNHTNDGAGRPPGPREGEGRRFRSGDVVVGDWVWGAGGWRAHPVIRVDRFSVTVGVHRVDGGWVTTEILRWEDIRGVIPAVPDLPADLAQTLDDAQRRVAGGFLDREQRAALAALLQIAGSATLPTPVTAVLFTAITALTRTSNNPDGNNPHDNDPDGNDPDDSMGAGRDD
jgi:hypothetical protein